MWKFKFKINHKESCSTFKEFFKISGDTCPSLGASVEYWQDENHT